MAHPAESAFVGAIIGLVTALIAFPTRVGRLLAPAGGVVVDGLRWASTTFPKPVFILAVFFGTMVVVVVVAFEFARVGYALIRLAGPRAKRVYQFVTPNTTIWKEAFSICLTVVFLLGLAWTVPYVIGGIVENNPIKNTSDLADQSEPQERLEEASDYWKNGLRGDVAITAGDSIVDARGYDRPHPDADGDRLKDDWERRGRTPDGAALPNADPNRMDLYVQFNYGSYTHPLTQREKRMLKEVWAEMPAQNPDGSTGITIHIDDTRKDGFGGAIGQEVVVNESTVVQYYTARSLGPRRCRYHQVVVGEVEGTALGRGSMPGFASAVEDQPGESDGEVPARVHIITHELLHNVAGVIDGRKHTEVGWLSHSNDTFLSDATAEELSDGFKGSANYQSNHC